MNLCTPRARRNGALPLVVAAIALTLGACATSKLAPPPSMGEISGTWLLETDGSPIRIVQAPADTVALTVFPEPVVLRQGVAVSDTTITVDINGLVVAGVAEVSKPPKRKGRAELVTTGSLEGQLTFSAPMLVFTGTWTGDAFKGTFQVDPERVKDDIAVLDAPRQWRLRRIGGKY